MIYSHGILFIKNDAMLTKELIMKNINELSKGARDYLNSLDYGINETSKGTILKFTGYHAQGKKMIEMVPEGYQFVKATQVWSEIKRTTINLIVIKKA